MKTLIIGCGFTGTHAARLLKARGHTVIGTTTTESRVDELRPVCDEVHLLNVNDESAEWAEVMKDIDVVVIAVGPPRTMQGDRASVYVNAAQRVVENAVGANLKKVVFTSSVGVYGDRGGDEVNEESEVKLESLQEGASDYGSLKAELVLQEGLADSKVGVSHVGVLIGLSGGIVFTSSWWIVWF